MEVHLEVFLSDLAKYVQYWNSPSGFTSITFPAHTPFKLTEASTSFFHLAQVFSQKDSLPSYTLSLFKSQAIIKAHIANITLASLPVEKILGVPLKHTLDLTVGGDGNDPSGKAKGKFKYKIEDARSEEVLLSAEREGYSGTDGV